MATGTYSPDPVFTGFDNSGVIVPSGKLFTYAAGTSTKLTTYTDVGLTSANTNPIVLDSAGRATIFLGPYSYKYVLAPSTDTDPPANPYWTRDNIASVPNTNVDLDITGTAGEALTANDFVYCSDGSGGATAGRWYKTDADNTYSSTLAKSIGVAVADIASGSSGSIRIQGRVTGLTGLTAGTAYYLSATAAAITSVAPTNARLVCEADSTTSVILSYWVALIDASATQTGLVNLADQVMGAGVKTFGAPMPFKPGTSSSADAITSGRVSTNTTQVGNVNAGEDNLMTYSLPANSLSANGKAVRVTCYGSTAANANNKTIKAYFGATSLTMLSADPANNKPWVITFWVVRTGAATQYMWGMFNYGSNTVLVPAAVTPAETLSGAVTIKLTGEATATDDIVQNVMIVEVVG